MVQWGVVVVALLGIVVYPFVAIAFYRLLAGAETPDRPDRGDVDPPSAHETYQGRTIPGSKNGRGD